MAERKLFSGISFGKEKTRVALKATAGVLWAMSIAQSCGTQKLNEDLANASRLNVSLSVDPQVLAIYKTELEFKRVISFMVATTEIGVGLFLIGLRPQKPK